MILNRGALIFVDFVVHLNHEKSTEIHFAHCMLRVVLETMNIGTQVSIHVVETKKMNANEYIDSADLFGYSYLGANGRRV